MLSEEFIIAGPSGSWGESKYPRVSVAKIIIDSIKKYGDYVAFIDGETEATLTYSEILRRAAQLSSALCRVGLVKHDVVCLISDNNLNYIIPYLACLINGISVSHLNPEYTSYELRHALELCKPKLIFCSKSALPAVLETRQHFDTINFVVLLNSIGEKHHIRDYMNMDCLMKLGEEWSESFEPVEINPKEDVACIFMSSGTTGLPKAVMLTHYNIRYLLLNIEHKELGFGPGESTLYNLPSFHIYGSTILLPSLVARTKLIFMAKFNPDKYLSLIEKYRITRLYLVPSLALFLVKSPLVDKYNLKSIKGIACGGAGLRESTSVSLENRMGVPIYQMYGLTETSGIIIYTPKNTENAGSIGLLRPHTFAKVIDPESGKALGICQRGELCFKGDLIMKGYLHNKEATQATIDENSFLHSGDIGYYDENGYIFIVDRLKDIIKYKGFQISPSEIEAVLLTHVGVKDAAVVGIPDERTGEKPMAYVVRQPGADIDGTQLVNFVAGKLSPQKHLYGGVVFIDEIPKNPGGKIIRKNLGKCDIQK